MIKIILCGAAGRMGKEIINAIEEIEDIRIVAGIESKSNKFVGKTIGLVKIYDDILSVIDGADCIVEFTNHLATMENLKKVKDYKKPYIIGSTGFSGHELKEIEAYSKTFPIFLSPNMSIGINHLYNLIRLSARALSDYDIEIIETHHRGKKDAPSGTARAVARIIEETKPKIKIIYGREGIIGERKIEEVCINAVRGGDVVGEHRILFLGDGEFIELRHFATSRRCFVNGTIEAIRFMENKSPGLYGMKDLLGY